MFSGSIKRWKVLESQLKVKTEQSTNQLKRLCLTCWASRNDAVHSLYFCYSDVMKALMKICLLSKKPDERAEAEGLKNNMEIFECVLLTVIQGKILETIKTVPQSLQKHNTDIFQASKYLATAFRPLVKGVS